MSVKSFNIGDRFGRLIVLEKLPDSKYLCQCDCGGTCTPRKPNLINGNTKSCGCLHSEETLKRLIKHGMSKTETLYKTWGNIKNKCRNPRNRNYKNFGAKGIRICEEWQEFTNFYDWCIQSGYRKGLELLRLDKEDDYKPCNCGFALKRRPLIKITYDNKTMTLKEWGEYLAIDKSVLYMRLKSGWTLERALTGKKYK